MQGDRTEHSGCLIRNGSMQQHGEADGACYGPHAGCELPSIMSPEELSRRPRHTADPIAENRAMIDLAQAMAGSPEIILHGVADAALTLCAAHSAGLSLLEKQAFRWRAIVGQWAHYLGDSAPRDFSPCGMVFDSNAPLLFSHPERDFPCLGGMSPTMDEGLSVPFYADGKAVGTMWVMSHDESCRFDAEHLRIMTSLSAFAAAAYWILHSRDAPALLLREMSHRIKNLLAITGALVTLSARSATTPRNMALAVEERLGALVRAHDLTWRHLTDTDQPSRETTLHELTSTIVAPFGDHGTTGHERLVLTGEDVAIGSRGIANVALVLHELTTNAAKYGALTSPEGEIHVACARDGNECLLTWTERGGPPLEGAPCQHGFGDSLIDGIVQEGFGGRVSRDWRREGLIIRLSVPANAFAD